MAADERGAATSAAHLRSIMERLLGEGGFSRLSSAEPDTWAGSAGEEEDLASVIDVAAERLRYLRQFIDAPPPIPDEDVAEAAWPGSWLPLNRKERYYTGTVLPLLVASDGFAHLERFLTLCGLDSVRVTGSLDRVQELSFITEYGFAESVFTDDDKSAWPGEAEGDTPDLVIAGSDWLLAVEAKMFHNPSGADLRGQMERQGELVSMWAGAREIDPDRVRHVLLLPAELRDRVGEQPYPVVVWEDVLRRYARVGPSYWVQVLAEALSRRQELASRGAKPGSNATGSMTGAEIVAVHHDGVASFDRVGRSGGLKGSPLKSDLVGGRWRTTRYQVGLGSLPANNRHWMSLADFVAVVEGAGGASHHDGQG